MADYIERSSSVRLLELYHAEKDSRALDLLLARHRAWLWAYVRRYMSPAHRAFKASEDVVQDVLRRLIEKGPAFIPRDDDEFRRLVATIVLNEFRNKHDWIHAAKRTRAREHRIESSGISRIGIAANSASSPSNVAARREEGDFLQLALLLIPPDDAHVIRLREWEGLDFATIGAELGVAEGSARMRFHRAVQRMGNVAKDLRHGRLDEIAPDLPPPD